MGVQYEFASITDSPASWGLTRRNRNEAGKGLRNNVPSVNILPLLSNHNVGISFVY
jgi:hypothetical protein